MFLRGAIKKHTASYQKLAANSIHLNNSTRAFSVKDVI